MTEIELVSPISRRAGTAKRSDLLAKLRGGPLQSIVRGLCFAICILATIALVLNTASVSLQTRLPELSLHLNPFNTEARVNVAYARLEAERSAPAPETIDIINAGIVHTPLDARFYSLMGLTAEQTDDRDTAAILYKQALKILPTEVMALANTLGMAYERGDISATIDQLEIIGRRWGYWPAIEAIIPELLSDSQAFAAVTSRFAQDDILRARLIDALTASSEGMIHLTPVLLAWHERKILDLDPLVNQATSLLVSQDLAEEGYDLFKRTRPGGVISGTNLLYNGTFNQPVRGNRFDWQVRRQAGVDFEFVGQSTDAAESNSNETSDGTVDTQKGLSIRFLGTPVRRGSVSQLIGMAPGAYQLSVAYSARGLRVPKPLRLIIACLGSNNARLAMHVFEQEDASATEESISFTVPDADCSMQRVYVSTQETPNSWRQSYLYSGTLLLNRIAIMPARG